MDNEIVLNLLSDDNKNIYYISETGEFPVISPWVTLDNLASGDKLVRVWSEQTITFNENGRNDKHYKEVELLKQAQRQTIPIVLSELRGGRLDILCKATIDPRVGSNVTVVSKTITFTIWGRQPVKEKVRKELIHPYLSAFVYLKTKFNHFSTDGRPNCLVGWGIYGIEKPTPSQVWSWKEGVQVANADYEKQKKAASEYPAKLRATNPAEYKRIPDFNEEQLNLEALQAFGHGMYHVPRRSGILGKWSWVKNTDNDNLAERALTVLKRVSQGDIPDGWD